MYLSLCDPPNKISLEAFRSSRPSCTCCRFRAKPVLIHERYGSRALKRHAERETPSSPSRNRSAAMRHARLSERSSARPCTTEEKRTNNSVAQAQQQQGRRTNAPTNNMEEGASRCHRHHHGTGGRAGERAGDRVTDIIARNGTRPRRASVTRRRARTIILFFSCSSAQREQQEHCLSVKGGERENATDHNDDGGGAEAGKKAKLCTGLSSRARHARPADFGNHHRAGQQPSRENSQR